MISGVGKQKRTEKTRTEGEQFSTDPQYDDLKHLFEARLPASTITPKITWLEFQMQNKTQRMCLRLVNVNHDAWLE